MASMTLMSLSMAVLGAVLFLKDNGADSTVLRWKEKNLKNYNNWYGSIIDMDQFYSWYYFVLNIYSFPFCRVVPVLCVVVFMFSFGKQKHKEKRDPHPPCNTTINRAGPSNQVLLNIHCRPPWWSPPFSPSPFSHSSDNQHQSGRKCGVGSQRTCSHFFGS